MVGCYTFRLKLVVGALFEGRFTFRNRPVHQRTREQPHNAHAYAPISTQFPRTSHDAYSEEFEEEANELDPILENLMTPRGDLDGLGAGVMPAGRSKSVVLCGATGGPAGAGTSATNRVSAPASLLGGGLLPPRAGGAGEGAALGQELEDIFEKGDQSGQIGGEMGI